MSRPGGRNCLGFYFSDKGAEISRQCAWRQLSLWPQRRIDGLDRQPQVAILIGHSRRMISPACHAAGTKRGVAAEPVIGCETWSGDHARTSTSSRVQCGVRSAWEEIFTDDGKYDG